jgi:hypothetical protein
MSQRRKSGDAGKNGAEQSTRDAEVLRAKRELDAYFRGRRTEREARAALKILKNFVRDRERQQPRRRPPLPGVRGDHKATRIASIPIESQLDAEPLETPEPEKKTH